MNMAARRMARTVSNDEAATSALVHLWILRALVPLGGTREFLHSYGYTDDALATHLGLSRTEGTFDIGKGLTVLRNMHKKAESKAANCRFPPLLISNIERIAHLLGLNECDKAVLAFAAVLHVDPWLQKAINSLGGLRSSRLVEALSVMLDINREKIRMAVHPRSPLFESGLLQSELFPNDGLAAKLSFPSDSMAERLINEDVDPISLIRDTVIISDPAELTLEGFGHLKQELSVLKPYLKRSLEAKRPGVNIFIHGVPGTGKTQFVRALAMALDCELFEVVSQDAKGDTIDPQSRLRSFRASQGMLRQRRALILFDETEDVFSGDFDGFGFMRSKGVAGKHKAWMNRLLESNHVPTFWVSNSADCMDAAYLRRFDMVLEMPLPSRQLREKLIDDACGDLIDEPTKAALAEARGLAPAVIQRASRVIRSIRDDLPSEAAAPALKRLIEGTLISQGHGALMSGVADVLPDNYDPRNIAADADLLVVSKGIVAARTGRLCLYGPPGTGKSAYGRWLARQLDVPLHAKRISDLVSPYVGQTERNLARAFHEAGNEGALLLFDEVDSFLRDRMMAKNAWEISAVNEMLMQMEAFPGVFIASTNLMDGLDQAALRRFDLKVKFDFMRPDQAWTLFIAYCKSFGVTAPRQALRSELRRLVSLTPGDFAAVARQHRFRPVKDAMAFIGALQAECEIKRNQAAKPIGFLA